jgi:hypothetical protein
MLAIIRCKVISMQDIREIIDQKFEIAQDYFAEGKDSICLFEPVFESSFEVIALDSSKGPDSRCVLTRNCLGSAEIEINGVNILFCGAEITRMEGDDRLFEDLPMEEIEDQGHIFVVGVQSESAVIKTTNVRPDWLTVEGLSRALSQMRVVERIPLSLVEACKPQLS